MPIYTFQINGQRHAFEGPDQQTAARFAQRWADQVAGRTPVTVSDIQQRLGPKPSNLSMDLNSRSRADLGDLNATIADVRAHPTSLLNAPKVLGAVGRYVPNAIGLAPAAGLDQVTGPIVRGVNSRFGTNYDPHYVTDQILSAVGLIGGGAEASPSSGAYRSVSRAAEAAPSEGQVARGLPANGAPAVAPPAELLPDQPHANPSTPETPAGGAPPKLRLVTASDQGSPIARSPSPSGGSPPSFAVVNGGKYVRPPGVMIARPTNEFEAKLEQNLHSLSDLPPDIHHDFKSSVNDIVYGPLLDDPDFQGYDAEHASNIASKLSELSDQYRSQGGLYSRLPEVSDRINGDFASMIDDQMSGGIATRKPASGGFENNTVVKFPDKLSSSPNGSRIPGMSESELNRILNMDKEERDAYLDHLRMYTTKVNEDLPDGVVNLVTSRPTGRVPGSPGWNPNPSAPLQFPTVRQTPTDSEIVLPQSDPASMSAPAAESATVDANAPNAFASSNSWSSLAAAIAARVPRSVTGLDLTNFGSNAMIPAIVAARAPQGSQVGQQGQ
jgi:hypothetical protein